MLCGPPRHERLVTAEIDPDAEPTLERNLGPQPLAALMEQHGLVPHDLVVASPEQITHKMVTRGLKGRRLTPRVQRKLLAALRAATGQAHVLGDLFNY